MEARQNTPLWKLICQQTQNFKNMTSLASQDPGKWFLALTNNAQIMLVLGKRFFKGINDSTETLWILMMLFALICLLQCPQDNFHASLWFIFPEECWHFNFGKYLPWSWIRAINLQTHLKFEGAASKREKFLLRFLHFWSWPYFSFCLINPWAWSEMFPH